MPRAWTVLVGWLHAGTMLPAAKLVALPSLTGLLTGAVGIFFVEIIDLVQLLAIGSEAAPLKVVPTLPWWRVVLAPALGGLVVGPLLHLLAPEAKGHGVPQVIEAFAIGGGRIRPRVVAVKSLASAITIGSGGSVGREGPIVQIGAGVGSALGQLLRLPSDQIKTLVACGAGAGIAAVFNAPLAGAFFALEVITGNFAMPAFGPVVLSCVMATIVSQSWYGDTPAFLVPPYRLDTAWEVGTYGVLGVVCGLVAVAFIATMDLFERLAPRVRVPAMWRAALGGLVLGPLLVVLPELYGVGYRTMDEALAGTLPWMTMAALIPLKIFATCLTLASGGSGGLFLPCLYIGAVAGGLYGTGVHALFPAVVTTSGPYALVGMAGVLAAATNSPITALLLMLEVTNDYTVVLPVMLVTTLATLIGRALKPEHLYSITRRDVALQRREELVMQTRTVAEVMRPPTTRVPDRTSVADVVRFFLTHDVASLLVVGPDESFVGTISIHDMKTADLRDLGPLVVAADLAQTHGPRVAPLDTLAAAMDEFVASSGDELPVVDAGSRLVGVVSRRDVLRLYSTELLRHDYLGVVDPATHPTGGTYVRLAGGFTLARVPVPAWLVGRSLRGADLRTTCRVTVVATRTAGAPGDELPDPNSLLDADTELVVVGNAPDLERFRRGPAGG